MAPPLIFVTSATNDAVMVAPQGFLSERQWDSYQKALAVVETTCVRGGIQIPARQAQLFIESLGGAISCNLTESALAIVQEASLARPPINEHVGQERLLHFTMLNTGRYLYPFQEDGVRWLAPRREALLADSMGLGKLQPMKTPVLTPSGWMKIGDLRVGDFVIGSDGRPTEVLAVYPQGRKAAYRVTFSDRSSTLAGAEHLWTVLHKRGGKEWESLVLTTEQLRARPIIDRPGGKKLDLSKTTLRLPMLSRPVEFASGGATLPLEPYMLGVLIANGYIGGDRDSSMTISVNENDWGEVAGRAVVRRWITSSHNYPGCVRSRLRPSLGPILRGLGLRVRSGAKRIPREYLEATPIDRVKLLHGLMDCDGSCSANNSRLTYHTTSPGLASDVRELVEGLGGIASVRSYDRERIGKGVEYRVRIRLPEWVLPFEAERKLSRYKPGRLARPCRNVVSVEREGTEESVCIRVAAEDHLYLTEHCIVTHNTPQLLVSLPPGAPVIVLVPAVVVTNWHREATTWRPDYRATMIKKRAAWRLPEPGEIVIASYGMAPAPGDEAISLPQGIHLVSDESHLLKGTTDRHRTFKALHAAAKAANGVTWLASGTPLQNHPPELWNVLSCAGLEREAFTSWPRFCHLFGGAKTKFIPVKGRRGGRRVVEWSGKPRPEVNACLQKVWLRRTKEEVLPDLPAKRRTDVFLGSLDQATAKACDEAMAALAAAGVHLTGDDSDDLLDKIKDPDHVSQLAKARAQLAAAKVAPCVEIVEEFEEAEEPIVVASAYVAPCKALGARPGWACITGETPTAERGRIVDRFQAGELKGLALTYRAGGVGITLTRASNMILLDLDWTPAQISQMEDRECRIGQTRGVLIQRLVADHALDRHVIRLLTRKQRMIDEVERKAP